MAVAVSTGMEKAAMKKLLIRSKEEPISCAVGVAPDGKSGLFTAHKTKNGRALESQLKSDFPDAKNTRFGTAFVDVDDNPKLVKLTLNRPVSGIARRLIKTFKGTGFTRVILMTEDGSVMEQFEEEDEEEQVADSGTAAPAEAAASAPPPPEAPEAPPAGPDAATLTKALAALVQRIPAASGGDPARQEPMAKLARLANVEIKTNNLTYAANSIAQLQALVGAPAPAAPAAPPPPPPGGPAPAGQTPEQKAALTAALNKQLAALVPNVAKAANGNADLQAELARLARLANTEIKTGNLVYAANTLNQLKKAMGGSGGAATDGAPAAEAATAALAASRVAWSGMRDRVAAEVDKLRAALAQTYAGQSFADQIASAFTAKTAPVLARFDDRLSTALDGLAAETDAGRRTALADGARKLVGEYQAFADGDALIGDLDDNPFAPLTIRSQAAAALKDVAAAIG